MSYAPFSNLPADIRLPAHSGAGDNVFPAGGGKSRLAVLVASAASSESALVAVAAYSAPTPVIYWTRRMLPSTSSSNPLLQHVFEYPLSGGRKNVAEQQDR